MLRKLTVCLLLCLLTCLRSAAQDRSTPEATVVSFITAYAQGNMKSVVACVKGVQVNQAFLDAIAQQVKKDPATLSLTDAKTTVNGSTAFVTGQVVIKSAKSEKTQNFATEVNLIQADGMWQIVPDAAKAQSETHPDLVNELAYALTDPKVFTRARDAARGAVCLSNVKQLCTATMMYVLDYDEVFKLKAETYKKSVLPYIKNESAFKCPSDSGTGITYAFNTNLTGVQQAKIHAPAETVMIYEGKNGKLDFRHDGKAVVGFADGHAKLITAEAAKKLRWKP